MTFPGQGSGRAITQFEVQLAGQPEKRRTTELSMVASLGLGFNAARISVLIRG